jgi:hypothetical protein
MQWFPMPRGLTSLPPRRRALIAVAALVSFGLVVTVTQVASAESGRGTGSGPAPTSGPSGGAPSGAPSSAPPLDVIADDCSDSELERHDGFQEGNRCVETQFGELGSAENNPSLLIVGAPRRVAANQPFTIRVSTRNLVRDRFLAAARGGYLRETSLLNDDGLVRGHFHTACRMLAELGQAPEPAPVPAFFVATEDGGGGAEPDVVEVQVPGLPEQGVAQCTVWAGDGSHRLPMMQRANQTPPVDSVRIAVRGCVRANMVDNTGAIRPVCATPEEAAIISRLSDN